MGKGTEIVKIVSDGTPKGTEVLTEDGKRITNLSNIEFSINADSVFAEVTMKLMDVEVDLCGENMTGVSLVLEREDAAVIFKKDGSLAVEIPFKGPDKDLPKHKVTAIILGMLLDDHNEELEKLIQNRRVILEEEIKMKAQHE